MTWANPHALWLLALIPAAAAALWWNAARRRRATQMFGRSATVDPLIAGRAQWWRSQFPRLNLHYEFTRTKSPSLSERSSESKFGERRPDSSRSQHIVRPP